MNSTNTTLSCIASQYSYLSQVLVQQRPCPYPVLLQPQPPPSPFNSSKNLPKHKYINKSERQHTLLAVNTRPQHATAKNVCHFPTE